MTANFALAIRFNTARKVSNYGVFSDPYFPVFGLNTEIYGVNLRIQSEYRKIRTRKNSVFGHISRSANKTLSDFLNVWKGNLAFRVNWFQM